MKFILLVLLANQAVAWADTRVPQRGLLHHIQKGVAGPNPYVFLTLPNGRSQALLQGFEVLEETENNNRKAAVDEDFDDNNTDDEESDEVVEENEDSDTDDDNDNDKHTDDTLDTLDEEQYNGDNGSVELDNVFSLSLKDLNAQKIKNTKATQMMVSRRHAGALMVPEQLIEIEGHSVIDEDTGKPTLLLPRSILESIPDGSVVALMEQSLEDEAEERANRVIVRRRRKGARRNIKRRRGSNKPYYVVTRPANYKRKKATVGRRCNCRSGNKRRVNANRISL